MLRASLAEPAWAASRAAQLFLPPRPGLEPPTSRAWAGSWRPKPARVRAPLTPRRLSPAFCAQLWVARLHCGELARQRCDGATRWSCAHDVDPVSLSSPCRGLARPIPERVPRCPCVVSLGGSLPRHPAHRAPACGRIGLAWGGRDRTCDPSTRPPTRTPGREHDPPLRSTLRIQG